MTTGKNDNQFKRKTPLQQRAASTVNTIYEATAQLLQNEPDREITTNKIAERAGFSIGTIYQYFSNKDALIASMAAHERDRINAAVRAALSDAENLPLEDIVRRLVRVALKAFQGRVRVRKFLVLYLTKADKMHIFFKAQSEVMDFIISEIRRVNRPDIREPDEITSFVMSRAMLSTIRSAVLEDFKHFNAPQFEDELVRLVKGYITVT